MRWLRGAARIADRAALALETGRGLLVLFLVALAVWWLEALVTPLGAGRDLGTYLGAYVQLFWSHPVDLGYLLGRTPIAPLVVGGLLDIGHGALAEPVVSLLYAASILAWTLAARSFGGRAALLTAVVLVLYPGYGILFHELASDSVFAAAFAGWSLLVVRVLLRPTPSRFALVGLGIGLLVLVRPGNQALLVLALVPLAAALPWPSRAASVAAVAVPAVLIMGAWALNNGVRYGDYTVSRGGNATVPFYRAYVVDRIVRPDNGPASRQLARAVQHDLLRTEPYRSYGIDLHEFFADGSPRMQTDLIALANEKWGWKSDARKLRDVGVEAVETHPLVYAQGVATTMWRLLRDPVFRPVPAASSAAPGAGRASSGGSSDGSGGGATIVVNGRRLPKPTEGEPIPAPHEGGVTTPDRSIYTVWTSPTDHHQVFVHPDAKRRFVELHARMTQLAGNLPDRNGNAALALRLNQSSRWYVPPVFWLVLGAIALAWRRPRGTLALLVPALAGLIVDLVSALGLPAVPEYSVPTAPAFVLLASGALFGIRRRAPAEATHPGREGAPPVGSATVA